MPKYAFLSDEWVGEAKRIYAEAGASGAIGTATSLAPVRVNLVVTDAPFSSAPVDAHVDTSAGRFDIDVGHLPEPDVTISLGYDTARSLFVQGDVQAVLQAFLGGRIKVDGDLTKLLDPRSGIWPSAQPGASSGRGAAGAGLLGVGGGLLGGSSPGGGAAGGGPGSTDDEAAGTGAAGQGAGEPESSGAGGDSHGAAGPGGGGEDSSGRDSAEPAAAGPSVSGPAVSGPATSGPAASGPAASGPAGSDRTGATVGPLGQQGFGFGGSHAFQVATRLQEITE